MALLSELPEDLREMVEARYAAPVIWEQRKGRQASLARWKSRIEEADELYRGDFAVSKPDITKTERPRVQNIYRDSIHDLANITAEAVPTVMCDPAGISQHARRDADIAEAVAKTHRAADGLDSLTSLLAMDLTGCGAAFLWSYPSSHSDYPVHMRLDPRGVYPALVGTRLLDVVVAQRFKARDLARMYPEWELDVKLDSEDEAEVVDFFDSESCVKCIYFIGRTPISSLKKVPPGHVVEWMDHGLGRIPVAFARLPSFDGEFRGLLDQVKDPLVTYNEVVSLMLDQADQAVHSPLLEYEIRNPQDYGPGAILHKERQESTLDRVPPAQMNPQLFAITGELERAARGGAVYPASRQGEVSQSIASASFVAATQGERSSVVRSLQRHLAALWGQQAEIDFAIDRKHLDIEKPLLYAVGSKQTYKPSQVSEKVRVRVSYGIASGVDKLNQGVYLLQMQGAQIISKETVREQLDIVSDNASEALKVERELLEMSTSQALLTDPSMPWTVKLKLLEEMNKGRSLYQAAKNLAEMLEAAQQAQAQPEAGAVPGAPGEMAPEDIDAELLALQKGGIPGGVEPGQLSLPPPVMTQSFLQTGR